AMSSRHSIRQTGKLAERCSAEQIARIIGGPLMMGCRGGNNNGLDEQIPGIWESRTGRPGGRDGYQWCAV
ncbi:MAG TPA: hypothetical protein VGK75_13945, partial [Casimicrobiaceae bacterium]